MAPGPKCLPNYTKQEIKTPHNDENSLDVIPPYFFQSALTSHYPFDGLGVGRLGRYPCPSYRGIAGKQTSDLAKVKRLSDRIWASPLNPRLLGQVLLLGWLKDCVTGVTNGLKSQSGTAALHFATPTDHPYNPGSHFPNRGTGGSESCDPTASNAIQSSKR